MRHLKFLPVLLAVITFTVVGLGTARAEGGTSACSRITLATPHSEACNAEIAAFPAPDLERPVVFDAKLDGVSTPRSVLLPENGTPYPIGWLLKAWYYSDAPGVEPPAYTPDRIVEKAALVYLYATVNVNGRDWHMIAPDRWIEGEHIAALYFPEKPENVSGQWIALDLTEQTLIAYEDSQPIFVTLISAAWEGYGVTQEGLFNIYARAKHTTFRGPPWKLDNPDYVYKFVPHVQFFDGNIALHGAYWHDWFGFPRSHGCVNIPVGDARWLWDWVAQSADKWGGDTGYWLPKPEAAPFVYVYSSPRTGDTRLR